MQVIIKLEIIWMNHYNSQLNKVKYQINLILIKLMLYMIFKIKIKIYFINKLVLWFENIYIYILL